MTWIRSPDLAAITVQRSANWANNPTGSRYLSWFIWRTISFTANSQYYSLVTMWSTFSRFLENEPNETCCYLSDLPISSRLEIFPYLPPSHNSRDLTIRQRRRQWKRHWKIDFASFKLLRDYPKSPSHLKKGNFCWSWREGQYPSVDRDDRIYRLAVPVKKKKIIIIIIRFGHFTW